MVDVSQISINDTNELYGLSDSENENFRVRLYFLISYNSQYVCNLHQ